MLRSLLMSFAFALLAPTIAHAEDVLDFDASAEEFTEDLTEDFNNRRCSVYDGQPDRCGLLSGCYYDYQWATCNDYGGGGGGGGGGGNRGCSSYDFDPYLCNSQSSCSYNHSIRRCEDSWSNQPGQCWRYTNQPRICDQQPGCFWDRRSAQCVDNWNNPPPTRRPLTRNVVCGSGNYRFERCQIEGEIVSAYLLRQLSSARCVQGQTWGFDTYGVWVDRGCRADFSVTYYSRW